MKLYELTYLISSKLKEESIRILFSGIESLVQEQGGSVIENKKERVVSLGYEIKGEKTAIMAVLKFRLPPEKQGLFREAIKEKSEILRFVIEKTRLAKPKRIITKRIKKVPEEKGSKKVELKGIEEKLEEILGE